MINIDKLHKFNNIMTSVSPISIFNCHFDVSNLMVGIANETWTPKHT